MPCSVTIELFGTSCLCLGIDALIADERAVGRPKGLEAVAELELIRGSAKKREV